MEAPTKNLTVLKASERSSATASHNRSVLAWCTRPRAVSFRANTSENDRHRKMRKCGEMEGDIGSYSSQNKTLLSKLQLGAFFVSIARVL